MCLLRTKKTLAKKNKEFLENFLFDSFLLKISYRLFQFLLIFLINFLESLISKKMEGSKVNDDQMFQGSWFQYQDNHMKINNGHDEEEKCSSSTTTSSIGEESTVSNGSSISSSDDIADDASSPSPSPSIWSNSSRALYNLSEIMEQLPIKRGLSKFYQGKSESFTSLSRAESIEDLAKKTIPYRRNLKASKSYAHGLNSYKSYTLPKPIISKKNSRGSSFSSFASKRGSFISSKPPLHKHLEC